MTLFYGQILHPHKDVKIESSSTSLIHISNLALPAKAAGVTHVYIKKAGKRFLVATLDPAKQAQVAVDFYVFAHEVTFFVEGSSEVHAIGYCEASPAEEHEHASRKNSQQSHNEKKAEAGKVHAKKSEDLDDLDEKDLKPSKPQHATQKPQQQ